jgi:hypothetical protein
MKKEEENPKPFFLNIFLNFKPRHATESVRNNVQQYIGMLRMMLGAP